MTTTLLGGGQNETRKMLLEKIYAATRIGWRASRRGAFRGAFGAVLRGGYGGQCW